MPLISLNPKTKDMLAADYAKLSNQHMIVIDNSKYHTLASDKKATVLAYYDAIILSCHQRRAGRPDQIKSSKRSRSA